MEGSAPGGGGRLTRRRLLQGAAAIASATVIDLGGRPSRASGEDREGLFSLGIASGDPAPDGMVLWTRLARDPLAPDGRGGMPSRPLPVRWEVATDERMTRVARRGVAVAHPAAAHTVHVEVAGLSADTPYFYRFRRGAELSPVGRTRTAPAPGRTPGPLTMCFTSCADYAKGFFTAYRHLAEEQPDLVLHLGDYIYETGGGLRQHAPAHPPLTLADYRLRHAQYRTDPDLQEAHAAAPWVVVWDDHDVENNYAGVHSARPGETGFPRRRDAAYRAYGEHLPLRRSALPGGSGQHLYRRIGWGRLATFHMLDTRRYRDVQACGGVIADCRGAYDPNRSIMGGRQERWLLDGLARSTSVWDVLGQQVFFGVRDLQVGPGTQYSMDSWDGYSSERQRLLDGMVERRVANPVILTGDVHKHYANDVTRHPVGPGGSPVASELVTSSVTTGGDGSDTTAETRGQLVDNPQMRFACAQRGYVRTRLEAGRLTADFRVLPYVTRPGAPVSTRASFVVEAGRPGLQRTG